MAKMIAVFTLAIPVSGLFDFNGNAEKHPQLHHLYQTDAGNTEIGKKLYKGDVNGLFDPSSLDAKVKAYHKPKPPIPKPATPKNLATSGVTETEIHLTWDAVVNASGYVVGITPSIAGYPKSVSTALDNITGLTKATAYTLTVKAKNASGVSADATKVVSTAAGTAPAKATTPASSDSSDEPEQSKKDKKKRKNKGTSKDS